MVNTVPERWFAVRNEYSASREAFEAMKRTPAGLLVRDNDLTRLNWKIGDRVTLKTQTPQMNGSTDWTYDIVGVFTNLKLGDQVELPQGPCTVVGLFESNGDSHESELHTDGPTLAAPIQFVGYHSGTVLLESAAAFDAFKRAVTTNPTLTINVKREPQYFAEASKGISTALTTIAWFVGGVMTFGAVFGALNIMYCAVSRRGVEIATLRALGFRSSAIIFSVLIEALMLAFLGALLGAAVTWLLFNGSSVSTVAGGLPSQMTYSLSVNAPLIAMGAAAACVIGIIGGLFPALRASRLPVAQALRGI